MNKNAIQKFAIWARNELIAQVSQRAYQYGIDESGFGDASADTLNGRLLTAEEKSQRQELIKQIKEKGYQQVMEEVAYTWFNRFIALRFMEVNNYLPSHIRVFSDASGAFKPEILNDVLHLDLLGLDSGKVAEYIESNDTEALYRYLLLTQCNALNSALPVMFERMGGYTEMLLPNNILRQDSVLGHMVSDIPEEDWQDAVQIIGWLYQYYNTELKDDTFAQLKKNVKITKERIPSATQLFTPDWIVRYMVENSLGRLWLEGHPNAELHDGWKYYLDEAEQEPEVEAQLAKLREEYKTIKPEEIKVIDPCMGSGHILVYAFDVLMQIYTVQGYTQRDAARLIVENNLHGLDIDQRAHQLAYFAVMMKARQYDRRILNGKTEPKLYVVRGSGDIRREQLAHLGAQLSELERNNARVQLESVLDALAGAEEYGSITNVPAADWELLERFINSPETEGQLSMDALELETAQTQLLRLVKQARVMAQNYDVVCTNPPYMGGSGMNARLAEYVKANYPDAKSDLFACFIEHGNQMVVKHGYNCMVTMQSWMFLSSFEKMREKILRTKSITNLMHMENMVMGIAFGTAVTVFRNDYVTGYKGTYNQIKLKDIENDKPKEFPVSGNRFAQTSTDNFSKIPGSPVAYWASLADFKCFEKGIYINQVAIPASGTSTGNNDLFLRLWNEVPFGNVNLHAKNGTLPAGRWFPCNKGGAYRRWSGGSEYVIDWENDGQRVRACPKAFLRNANSVFKSGLTWSKLGSGTFSIRYFRDGYICESIGCGLFAGTANILNCLGLLNSVVAERLLAIINPSMGRQPGYIGAVPYLVGSDAESVIQMLVKMNIDVSNIDWDSYETSWDFKRSPLV